VKVRCLHTLAEIEPLRDRMNEVNLASAAPDPFSTYEFIRNLIERGPVSQQGRVWLLAAFVGPLRGSDSDSTLIGYVALKERHGRVAGLRTVTVDFLVEHDADRPHVVALPTYLAEVIEEFYAYLHGRQEWDLLEFQQQDAASNLFPLPKGIARRGWWARDWPNMDNYTIAVSWGTLSEYVLALSPKFRAEIKRYMRKLLAIGDLALLVSSDPASTPALFELYCAIEHRSWKSRADLTVSGNAFRKACMRGLLRPNQPMQIVIQILLRDGVPIAGLINGSFDAGSHRTLYALHTVFDDRYSAASPGSTMLLFGMRQAIGGRYACFNLLSGFGHYKHRWLASATPTKSAQIYRVGRLPFWRRIGGDAVRILRSLIRPNRDAAEPLFNPSRRESRPTVEGNFSTNSQVPIGAAERQRFANWIETARSGNCEWLQGEDFIDALPFSEFGESSARQGRAASGQVPDNQVTSETTDTLCAGDMNRSDRMTMPVTLITSPTKTPSGAPKTPSCVIPT
jgi:hypothetical protein